MRLKRLESEVNIYIYIIYTYVYIYIFFNSYYQRMSSPCSGCETFLSEFGADHCQDTWSQGTGCFVPFLLPSTKRPLLLHRRTMTKPFFRRTMLQWHMYIYLYIYTYVYIYIHICKYFFDSSELVTFVQHSFVRQGLTIFNEGLIIQSNHLGRFTFWARITFAKPLLDVMAFLYCLRIKFHFVLIHEFVKVPFYGQCINTSFAQEPLFEHLFQHFILRTFNIHLDEFSGFRYNRMNLFQQFCKNKCLYWHWNPHMMIDFDCPVGTGESEIVGCGSLFTPKSDVFGEIADRFREPLDLPPHSLVSLLNLCKSLGPSWVRFDPNATFTCDTRRLRSKRCIAKHTIEDLQVGCILVQMRLKQFTNMRSTIWPKSRKRNLHPETNSKILASSSTTGISFRWIKDVASSLQSPSESTFDKKSAKRNRPNMGERSCADGSANVSELCFGPEWLWPKICIYIYRFEFNDFRGRFQDLKCQDMVATGALWILWSAHAATQKGSAQKPPQPPMSVTRTLPNLGHTLAFSNTILLASYQKTLQEAPLHIRKNKTKIERHCLVGGFNPSDKY